MLEPFCIRALLVGWDNIGSLVVNRAKNEGYNYRDNDRESNYKPPFAKSNFFTLRF